MKTTDVQRTAYARALAHPLVASVLFHSDPAWLWSTSGEKVLWANEAGCRFFDTKSMGDLLTRKFRRVSPATVQIARMASVAKLNKPQESSLRFFRGMNPLTLTAKLELVELDDGTRAVFVRAKDAPEQIDNKQRGKMILRLMKLFSRSEAPAAILSAKGEQKEASRAFDSFHVKKRFLRQAAEQLKDHDTIEVALPGKQKSLFAVALRKKDKSISHIFTTITEQSAAVMIVDPETEKTVQSEITPKAEVDSQKDEKDTVVALVDNETSTPEPSAQKKDWTRFLIAMDAEGTITSVSPEFKMHIGPETGDIKNKKWADISSEYNLDPQGDIERHIKREAIWTETLYWPLSEKTHDNKPRYRAPVTLTAMPIFNAQRVFEGFRGFGSISIKDASVKAHLDVPNEQEVDDENTDDKTSEQDASVENQETNSEQSSEDVIHLTTTQNENKEQPVSEELMWQTDADEEEIIPRKPEEKNASADDNIVPLHRRPVPLRDISSHEQEDALSTPERKAFQQIAEALNADFAQKEQQPQDEQEDQTTPSVTAEKETQDSDIDFNAASIIEGHTSPNTDKHKTQDAHAEQNDEDATQRHALVDQGMPLVAADLTDLPPRRSETLSYRSNLNDYHKTFEGFQDGILNRLPLGLIVARERHVLFANQSVLDFLGYDDIDAFRSAGGLETLFQADTEADPGSFVGRDILKHLTLKAEEQGINAPQMVRTRLSDGTSVGIDIRLQSGDWQGEEALLMALSARVESDDFTQSDGQQISELIGQSTDVMDIASDGILIIREDGKVLHANASSQALFGRDSDEIKSLEMAELFAQESQRLVVDYLESLTSNGVASVLNDGREVIGKEKNGGLLPLFITIGKLASVKDESSPVFCAVLRDITQWKRAEEELIESRKVAENSNAQKSDFLAAVSHEIRTPLNAIIGFSEVMMDQHFGPIENSRYLEYARDINTSGNHLMSLVNDLLDLSKIEAGKLDMTFSSVSLNKVIQECVALMQPEANRDRIIIRTSLLDDVPAVVADSRSIRQIAFNLLSNAVKFTKSGGQVIISTTMEENGEVAIRVRDTGIGMSDEELSYAMKPFRQVHKEKSGRKSGTGLGLPLTKALVEANRATFTIDSRVDYGTLIQVIFPNERVLAD